MEILNFAENVKYLRELDGLKITEMHVATGFPRSTWNNYETGHSFPSFKDLIKISDYFGILESDILRTNISECDLEMAYLSYLNKQKIPFEVGDTPRAKTFIKYLDQYLGALPPAPNGGNASQNASPTASPTAKRAAKEPLKYGAKAAFKALVLHEPVTPYGKATPEQRLARIEAILGHFRDVLNIEIPT